MNSKIRETVVKEMQKLNTNSKLRNADFVKKSVDLIMKWNPSIQLNDKLLLAFIGSSEGGHAHFVLGICAKMLHRDRILQRRVNFKAHDEADSILKSRGDYENWETEQYARNLCALLIEEKNAKEAGAIQRSCNKLINVIKDLWNSSELEQKYLILILNCLICRSEGICSDDAMIGEKTRKRRTSNTDESVSPEISDSDLEVQCTKQIRLEELLDDSNSEEEESLEVEDINGQRYLFNVIPTYEDKNLDFLCHNEADFVFNITTRDGALKATNSTHPVWSSDDEND